MATFQTLKSLVYKSIGRDSTDQLAAAVVPEAINYALDVVALLFKPPELNTSSNVTVAGGNSYASIADLDFIDVSKVYNSTDSRELLFVPFEEWDTIIPADLSIVKYYSIYGDRLYVKATPTTNKTLTVYHYAYPARLTLDSQSPEFDHYDSYIIAVAGALTFAALEEGESVDVWAKVADALGMPFLRGSAMREIIAGRQAQLESVITGAKK
jgi:hypothetical protein